MEINYFGTYPGIKHSYGQRCSGGGKQAVNSWSDIQIFVTVPQGATTGPLAVNVVTAVFLH